MSKPLEEKHVPRQVIQNQLLAALDDKSKVAILATADDLDMFIEGLAMFPYDPKKRQLCQDMKQLREAAFPKPSRPTKVFKSEPPGRDHNPDRDDKKS